MVLAQTCHLLENLYNGEQKQCKDFMLSKLPSGTQLVNLVTNNTIKFACISHKKLLIYIHCVCVCECDFFFAENMYTLCMVLSTYLASNICLVMSIVFL